MVAVAGSHDYFPVATYFPWLNSFWQILCVKAVRPLGLAVTAADYLDSARIDAPMSDLLHCCLQRYMMKPSLRSLGRLEHDAVSGGYGFRLRDKVLERQHSLGQRFTREALAVSREADAWVLSAKRICFSNLAIHVPEAFHATHRSASAIVAWISFKLKDVSRGRLSGFQQERSTDQSGHAERQALLNLMRHDKSKLAWAIKPIQTANMQNFGTLLFHVPLGLKSGPVEPDHPLGADSVYGAAATMKLLLKLLSPMDSFCCGCSLDFGIKLILLYQSLSCTYDVLSVLNSYVLEAKVFAETSPSSEALCFEAKSVLQLKFVLREAFSLFCALASIPFIACGWSGVLSVAQMRLVFWRDTDDNDLMMTSMGETGNQSGYNLNDKARS
eukprot:Skav218202  [mRNA]  locus=scaffold2232:71248:74915:- [translate_table: standard]